MASQDVTRVSSKRLTYNGWLDSNEDPKAYADHVNPVWVKLLDTLGMNANYTRATGSELHTSDGRTILDCLSGYCVHNVGHNRPFLVAELVAELQSQSPGMLQSHVVREAGKLARILCENAGGKVSKAFFCSSGSEGVEAVINFARAHTGKADLIYARGAFHGLTRGGALSDGKQLLARELRTDVRRNPRSSFRRSDIHRKAAGNQNDRRRDPGANSG